MHLKIRGDDVKVDPAKNKLDEEMITENQNNIFDKINEYNENVVDADAGYFKQFGYATKILP